MSKAVKTLTIVRGETNTMSTKSNTTKSDTRSNNNTGVSGVTPAGEAVFPKIVVPETKFDADGTYSLKLRLPDGPEADTLIAKIDEVRELAHQMAVNNAPNAAAAKKIRMADPSYGRELDRETGEETGNWLFNFKMKASGVSKKTGKPWSRKPALFDAKGQPIIGMTKNEEIWAGSVVKIAYELRPFYSPSFGAGCSQNLQAVQVIELVSGEGRSAEDFGFGEEDGSFFASATPDTTPFDMPTSSRLEKDGKEGKADGDF